MHYINSQYDSNVQTSSQSGDVTRIFRKMVLFIIFAFFKELKAKQHTLHSTIIHTPSPVYYE